MPQALIDYKKSDEYYTPEYAVIPILKHIRPKSKIWCPFDKEDSNYVKVFSSNGFQVVRGHIKEGQNFLESNIPDCDYIISNPPYSIKDKIFKRLFDIKKPFAMLVNMQGIFDSKIRFELFSKNKFEMMWIYPRVYYYSDDLGIAENVPFQSGYICSGMLERQVEFEYIGRPRKINFKPF